LSANSASALSKNATNRQLVNDWFQVSAKIVLVYALISGIQSAIVS